MLLYLDNSVLNRPFDDQRQPRIWLETLSFSLVLTLIETGEAKDSFADSRFGKRSQSVHIAAALDRKVSPIGGSERGAQ